MSAEIIGPVTVAIVAAVGYFLRQRWLETKRSITSKIDRVENTISELECLLTVESTREFTPEEHGEYARLLSNFESFIIESNDKRLQEILPKISIPRKGTTVEETQRIHGEIKQGFRNIKERISEKSFRKKLGKRLGP